MSDTAPLRVPHSCQSRSVSDQQVQAVDSALQPAYWDTQEWPPATPLRRCRRLPVTTEGLGLGFVGSTLASVNSGQEATQGDNAPDATSQTGMTAPVQKFRSVRTISLVSCAVHSVAIISADVLTWVGARTESAFRL